MPDQYEAVRSLPFPALASALGLDVRRYKPRRNGEYYGPCPIHGSKANQNCFSYADTGVFHCFSCNAKGRGAIDLVKLVRTLQFQAAVEFLGAVPIQSPAKKESAIVDDSVSDGELKPYTGKYEKFKVACPWLEARIPDAGVREKYGVFCYENKARKSAYSGRVMLPVKDVDGQLYGYLGRRVDYEGHSESRAKSDSDTPKYLFPAGLPKSRFLFGLHELVADKSAQLPLRVVYLVESPFCVMKFASLGLPAVSPFGWSVSPEQVSILKTLARGVVYLPDSNKFCESGSTVKTLSQDLWVRAPKLPEDCTDPEQLSREQILAL